jgi:hypothetical protein
MHGCPVSTDQRTAESHARLSNRAVGLVTLRQSGAGHRPTQDFSLPQPPGRLVGVGEIVAGGQGVGGGCRPGPARSR